MYLASLFSQTKKQSILVVGDFMLDAYTFGSVKRISPEAPVMVMNAKKESKLPGGAGNVVLNLVSLGAKVIPLGRLGDDAAKEELVEQLKKEKVNTSHLYIQKNYRTPIKNRIIAGNQQIVRIDFEEKESLLEKIEEEIIHKLPALLEEVSIIAISDYGKGFLTDKILSAIINQAKDKNILVIVDPKGKDFQKYSGAYIIKPNLSEAYEASGCHESDSLENVAKSIYQKTQIENLMITRSSHGISLFQHNKREDFPVKVKEVVDVTGAGDTVLAVLAFALSHKLPLDQAAILCNLAAAEVIEHLGCARISIKTLAELVLKQHLHHNKVFSRHYLQVFQFVLDYEDFIMLKVAIEKYVTPSFFLQLKTLKEKHPHSKLVLYLNQQKEDVEMTELLASLAEVDFIIKDQEDLKLFCNKHTPKNSYDFVDNKLEVISHSY